MARVPMVILNLARPCSDVSNPRRQFGSYKLQTSLRVCRLPVVWNTGIANFLTYSEFFVSKHPKEEGYKMHAAWCA